MQLMTDKEIKRMETEIRKGMRYRENFFGEVFAELMRNNENLALIVSKDVMSDESESDHEGVVKMILIGLKMLGATNNFDKNYTEISVGAIVNSKYAKIRRKDAEPRICTLVPDEVMRFLMEIAPSIMKDTAAIFDKVLARLESYVKLILTAGVTNIMTMRN